MDTDASAYAVDAVLQQCNKKGKLHPVTFMSKTMDSSQRNWDIYAKELFAVVEALTHWQLYLAGAQHQVVVQTDHQNLLYYKKPHDLNRREARWFQRLQDYDFVLKHIPGK